METYDLVGETEEEKGIFINEIKYLYSITKEKKEQEEEESLIIKLYNTNQQPGIYFTYVASLHKLMSDLKFLTLCNNLDEMIICLVEIFFKGNAKVKEINGNFYLELKFIGTGIEKKFLVQLIKKEYKENKTSKKDKQNEDNIYKNECVRLRRKKKDEKNFNIPNIIDTDKEDPLVEKIREEMKTDDQIIEKPGKCGCFIY